MGWKAGDKAAHKKWGIGMVVSVKGKAKNLELDIAFPEPVGIKRLLSKICTDRKSIRNGAEEEIMDQRQFEKRVQELNELLLNEYGHAYYVLDQPCAGC